MKKVIIIIYFLLSLMISSVYCEFMDDPIKNGATSRGLGMGLAFTAVADDSSSPIYNPAGLVSLKTPQATGMYYTKNFDMVKNMVFNGAYPTKYGTFGIGGVYSSIDNITITEPTTRSASYNDNLTYFSYASNLRRYINLGKITRRIYVGANLKIFQKNMADSSKYSATGMNMDIGLKYTPLRWLTFGVNKQNFLGGTLDWGTGEKEFYPSPLMVGSAIRILDRKQTIALDVEIPNENTKPTLFHVGTEYSALDNFTLRGGLDQMIDGDTEKASWNLALGLGLDLGEGFIIDYAYHPYYGQAENVAHFVTISYVGEQKKRVKGKIKVSQSVPESSMDMPE